MKEKKITLTLLCITAAAILGIIFYSFGASTQDGVQLISMAPLSASSGSEAAESDHTGDASAMVSSTKEDGIAESAIPSSTSELSAKEGQLEPKKVNLNTASLEELMTVPQIGEVTAGKILDYRKQIGAFTSVKELLNISGIGEKTLAKIQDYFTIE